MSRDRQERPASAPAPAPRLRGALVRPARLALLLALLLPAVLAAALNEADWRAGRLAACEAQVADGRASEAERLLVRTLQVRDAMATLGFMRAIASLPQGPAWVRAEALRALCEAFCVEGAVDSLEIRRAQLRALTGAGFDCPSAPEAVEARWAVQLGAFSSEDNARRALQSLAARGVDCRVAHDGRHWRALAGRFPDKAAAKAQGREWERLGWTGETRVFEEPAR